MSHMEHSEQVTSYMEHRRADDVTHGYRAGNIAHGPPQSRWRHTWTATEQVMSHTDHHKEWSVSFAKDRIVNPEAKPRVAQTLKAT